MLNVDMVSVHGIKMGVTFLGAQSGGMPLLVWAHGWGQSGATFFELAESFERLWPSILLDLPGFGRSELPPTGWSTADYADAIAEWLRTLRIGPLIWIGHSFGCRIGIQIAARHPGLIRGFALIAAAGLPRRRSPWERIKLDVRIYLFKLAKIILPEGPARDWLRSRLGSADYKGAGPLRETLVKTVSEDLTAQARTITCPTLIIYGREDKDTPPEIGERLANLIPGARLLVLEGYDHHNILVQGRHQLTNEIRKFVSNLK